MNEELMANTVNKHVLAVRRYESMLKESWKKGVKGKDRNNELYRFTGEYGISNDYALCLEEKIVKKIPSNPDTKIKFSNITDRLKFKANMDFAYLSFTDCSIYRDEYLTLVEKGRNIGLKNEEIREIEYEITSEEIIFGGYGLSPDDLI